MSILHRTLDELVSVCSEDDCSERTHAKRLCRKHYKRNQMRRWRENNPERARTYRREYYLAGNEYLRNFARRYGLTNEEAEAVLATKPEGCEICGRPGVQFDHDHKTGAHRGWLCGRCNTALGQAQDDPTLLRRLANYVETR